MWVKCTVALKESDFFTYGKVYKVDKSEGAMLLTANNGYRVEIEAHVIPDNAERKLYLTSGGFSWFAFREVDETVKEQDNLGSIDV